jgi:hypothetical protein
MALRPLCDKLITTFKLSQRRAPGLRDALALSLDLAHRRWIFVGVRSGGGQLEGKKPDAGNSPVSGTKASY